MAFTPKTVSRSWMVVANVKCFENAGLSELEYKNPEKVAEIFTAKWEDSGKNRTAGVAVCISATGCYHMHMALYGNTTTLKHVSELLFGAHVEPQLGKKEQLLNYLKKEGKYAEKGETVLYATGLENIRDGQGKRSDLDDITALLDEGATPEEIFRREFRYRRYEKMIRADYLQRKKDACPVVKENMIVEYHVGESGSGKSFTYQKLCKEHGLDKIYLISDSEVVNGGIDNYFLEGAPPILFIDEVKGYTNYGTLLRIMDSYSRHQLHCRYANAYCIWQKVVMTSIYPPEELFELLVEPAYRKRDSFQQFMRRITRIVYHYIDNGEYKTFSIPVSEYTNYRDLEIRARSDSDGFVHRDSEIEIPFA